MTLAWETVQRRVALAGRVVAGETMEPVAGARVELVSVPEELWWAVKAMTDALGLSFWDAFADHRARSAADGTFFLAPRLLAGADPAAFRHLPDGPYILHACLPAAGRRYGTAHSPAVKVEAAGPPPWIELVLPRTTLKGRVTVQGASDSSLVELRFQGDPRSTFTDRAGNYRLTGIESGSNRVLSVCYRGLQGLVEDVTIPHPGDVVKLNLTVVANAGNLTISQGG